MGIKNQDFHADFNLCKCALRERSPIFRFNFLIFWKPFSLKGESHQLLGYILASGKLN
jgi:hypothetical protein